MSAPNIFPTITGDIASRYIQTARLTPNAVALRIRQLAQPTMIRRCMYCSRDFGSTPCHPSMNGAVSHGVCGGDACRERHARDLGLSPSLCRADRLGEAESAQGCGDGDLLSSGSPPGDASQTDSAETPLRSAERLSSADCSAVQSSAKASGPCPPFDSFACSESWSSHGPSVPAKDSPDEGALGLRLTQPTNPAAA